MKLTQTTVNKLKPTDKATASRPDKHTDGNGLQLLVRTTGTKTYIAAYRWNGKQQTITLGKHPILSLQEARAHNLEIKRLIAQGINPKDKKKGDQLQASGAYLFDNIAKQYHDSHQAQVKPQTHRAALSLYKRHIKPAIGNMNVNDITAPQVLQIARKIEKNGSYEQARRVIRQVKQIFNRAIIEGLATNNPASDLTHAITRQPTKHHARITANDLPKLIKDIKAYKGHKLVKLGLLSLAYTFVRVSELITMQWQDIDFDNAIWSIPAHKMKMGRAHKVPLSPQMVNILQKIKSMNINSDYVFYNKATGKHYSRNAFINALHKMGYKDKMTAHGFRGLASTALHEQGFKHEVIELQLAHVKADKVSRAYNGAQHLPERKALMTKFSNYLDDMAAGGLDNVILFTAADKQQIAVNQ